MLLFGYDELRLWISSFFSYFSAPLFTVSGVTFSFLDIFIGGVKLSIIGFAFGCLVFKIRDSR